MSRQRIFDAIRRNRPPPVEHPGSIPASPLRFSDPLASFIEAVKSVGGQAESLASRTQIPALLKQRFPEAKIVSSLARGGPPSTLDLENNADPHDLAGVDLAVLDGVFGVAENGCVWVPEENMRWRALPFITQHLVLIVPAAATVPTLHEAYERLAAALSALSYGVLISGPSKTADIEQCLVIGAHGPRSLLVALVPE